MGDIAETPRPVELVLKAIRALPEAEQDTALAYLLERGLTSEPVTQTQLLSASRVRAMVAMTSTAPHLGGDLRPVPVRFPAPLYERLKAWCTENDFPMAVVVRGLVERFLDDHAEAGG